MNTLDRYLKNSVVKLLIIVIINNNVLQHIDWLSAYDWQVWSDEIFDKCS